MYVSLFCFSLSLSSDCLSLSFHLSVSSFWSSWGDGVWLCEGGTVNYSTHIAWVCVRECVGSWERRAQPKQQKPSSGSREKESLASHTHTAALLPFNVLRMSSCMFVSSLVSYCPALTQIYKPDRFLSPSSCLSLFLFHSLSLWMPVCGKYAIFYPHFGH